MSKLLAAILAAVFPVVTVSPAFAADKKEEKTEKADAKKKEGKKEMKKGEGKKKAEEKK